MFEVEWDPRALEELRRLRAFDRKRILDEVTAHLTTQANVEAGHRKLILDLQAPWSAGEEPFWQLKVEPYRVFYDIFPVPEGSNVEGRVRIQAVRLKPLGRATEEIL